MDLHEDDEVPQNEPGTSSNTQPTVPVLSFQPGSATSSQGPSTSTSSEDESTDNDDEHGEGESGPAIQSARSHDSGRTVLYPELYVLTNDEALDNDARSTQVCSSSSSRSFCFVTTENDEQQDLYNLTTIPGVQRSLCLEEVIDDSSSTRVEFPNGVDNQTRHMLERCMGTCGQAARARAKKKSRARKEASAKEVRGYYKQFAEAKHLEYKSWVDNGFFDLVDLRKVKAKNYVTRRWVLTIKTDKKSNSLRAPCMNDAPRCWWNILDKALCSYGMVPTCADRCCYVLCSLQSRKQAWEHWIQGAIAQQKGTKNAFTDTRE